MSRRTLATQREVEEAIGSGELIVDRQRFIRLRAAVHELGCGECRVTWRSWLARVLHVGGMAPTVTPLRRPRRDVRRG